MSILSAIEQVSTMLRARTWYAGVTLHLDDAVAAETLEALARARVVGVLDACSERVGQQWRVFANVAGPPMSLPYYCEIGGKTFGGDSYDAARATT